MYYEQKKKKRPFKLFIVLFVIIAFIVWVMLDDTGHAGVTNQVIEVQLPK